MIPAIGFNPSNGIANFHDNSRRERQGAYLRCSTQETALWNASAQLCKRWGPLLSLRDRKAEGCSTSLTACRSESLFASAVLSRSDRATKTRHSLGASHSILQFGRACCRSTTPAAVTLVPTRDRLVRPLSFFSSASPVSVIGLLLRTRT